MGRPPDPRKREEMLERCFRAALEGGSLELSLATLAERAGTSARVLVYHFGTREGLERALAGRLEDELQARFRGLEAATPGVELRAAILAGWDTITGESVRGLLRLVMDVVHRAQAGDPAARALNDLQMEQWEHLLAPLGPDRASALVLLGQGAVVDLLATGNAERGRRAMVAFLDALGTH
jgi:AcrR family transcriptional regulator